MGPNPTIVGSFANTQNTTRVFTQVVYIWWAKFPQKLFVSGRSYQRKRRYYARDETTGPTRMGMLQSIQAGTVRHGGCPVRSEVAHAKGRGDGNPAVRVRNVDPRQGALRSAANGTPQVSPTDHWLPVPTTHRPPHVVLMPRPLRRHNARASRRPSASGASSLRGPYSGRTISE